MRFNGPGCACALFGSGFGSAYSALLGRTHGAGRLWFRRPGCACAPFGPELGLLCALGPSALDWPVAFQWAGVAGIGKGYFSSSAAGEQNSPPQGFPEHAFFSITTGLPPGFTQACFSLTFSRLFVKNKHRPRSQNANIFVFPDGSLPFRQASMGKPSLLKKANSHFFRIKFVFCQSGKIA